MSTPTSQHDDIFPHFPSPAFSFNANAIFSFFFFFQVRTLADLAGVAREDVAELDELEAAERRTLWAFIQQHKPNKLRFPADLHLGNELKKFLNQTFHPPSIFSYIQQGMPRHVRQEPRVQVLAPAEPRHRVIVSENEFP